jgi:DNA mismatch endonuclease, patch repair protein
MPDIMSRRRRSALMSRIRGRDTRPEVDLRRRLWKKGLRYRTHFQRLAGRPDVVFIGAKVAVFVDGCFWHGCPEHRVWPSSRVSFWRKKLEGNQARDAAVTNQLRLAGWVVLRLWEHEIQSDPEAAANLVWVLVERRRALSAAKSRG